ncbi:MAG: protein-glutamate O-methyltransferase CheR [Pseudomonadota bacterium]
MSELRADDRFAPEFLAAREFALTATDFERLRSIAYRHAGIELGDGKQELLYGRLVRRLRKLQLPDFHAYANHLDDGGDDELESFINAITTNHTSFFREHHHFDFLRGWLSGDSPPQRPAIWSAGCSSGEEPYSIAMVCDEVEVSNSVNIWASDINTDMLARGRRGVFDQTMVSKMSNDQQRRWFLRGTGTNAGYVRIKERLRQKVAFEQTNFFGRWEKAPASFDFIFCRNVIIYFGRSKRTELLERFSTALRPGGYLVIGHSESIPEGLNFELCGRTIYRKSL